MRHGRSWLILFLLGSLWGLAEVLLGDLELQLAVLDTSVWLAALGLVVLAVARGVTPRPGTSTFLGVVATLFRLANTAPNYCHLSGILALAVTYDLLASLFKERHRLIGVAAAFGGRIAFVALAAGIWQSPYWLDGWSRTINHVLVGGSAVALLAALLVPPAVVLGQGGELLGARHPRWAIVLPTVAAGLVWIAPLLP